MLLHKITVEGIEFPLSLYGEAGIEIYYSKDKGEPQTEFTPGIPAHIVIEEVKILSITIEDEEGIKVKLPWKVLKEEILPVVENYLQDHEEELLNELS